MMGKRRDMWKDSKKRGRKIMNKVGEKREVG